MNPVHFVRFVPIPPHKPLRSAGLHEARGEPMGMRSYRRMFNPIYILIVWLLVAATTPVPLVGARPLVPAAELPFGTAAAAAFVDVFGDGSFELLLAGPLGIGLYTPSDEAQRATVTAWQQTSLTPPFPAPVTTITAADVTGDGVPEIVVGTAQAGAVYVLRRTGTGWTVLGQTPYMWSPVQSLHSADLSGDGKAEIVALDADGNVVVYGWQQLALQAVGRLPADVGPVTHIEIADLTGSGTPQLIVAERSGRISVWPWPLAEPMWQTFVWGLPASMVVTADAAGGPGQLVVTTYERLLYGHRWDGARFVATGAPLNDSRLPFTFMSPVRFAGDSGTYVLAHNATGLGVWRLAGTSLSAVDDGWADNPRWAVQVPGRDTFLVGEARHPVSLWERRPGDYFEFTVDGIRRPLNDPPLFRQSQVMLSARDWAAALGMQLYWEAPEQRLTVVRGYDYVIATMNEWEVILPRGRRGVTLAPVIQDGRTYMPPEFPAWFDMDYRWDARRRVLDVRTRL